TALRTPSMTPDPRAEELLPDSPGFRMRYCTLYGEMSAFLSEDLAQRPSPQPVFSLDIGRPELSLDLCTQLAVAEAKVWLSHVEHRFRTMRRILRTTQPVERAINHHVYALVSLIFSDVKAHVTVERAMYAVRPIVPLVSLESNTAVSEERIALRMHHLECHLLWKLSSSNASDSSSSSDDETGSFATGRETMDSSSDLEPASDGLTPSVQLWLTSSPITAQWSSSALQAETDVPAKTLLRVKHGIRARGSVDLRIGPTASRSAASRINANIDAEIGEVSGRLREHDFRRWLSMQPLWLVTELLHIASMDYSNSSSRHESSDQAASDAFHLPSLEARRKMLTATLRMVFESIRVTIMACDNEEDVRSGIEHGTQLCFQHGLIDIRANGGSMEAPHPFGFRADVGQTTMNIECQKATMFLLSAVPSQSARAEVLQSRAPLPAGFALSDLDGFLPDTVQAHIVLVSPQFNFSRQRLEPFRSRLIFDIKTTSLTGVTSVSSIYRWSVFMRHIQYWLRRKRLARRMATQVEEPSPPDDLIVSINSEMLDLRGSLVSPMFFNLDKGLAKCFHQAAKGESEEASSRPSPEMRLKMPRVEFAVERTKLGTDNDMKISLSGPIATLYGSSVPKGQSYACCLQPLMSLKECKATFCFPRKAKREQLGAEQGVRCNNSYDKIDVVFERGAMAFGHQYNMAETIDGFILLQKGCKRIARKSTSTCHPPLPFLEAALDRRPTNKMVLAALGNPRTYMPPPLRSLSS
ncbi:hypothetical protein GGI00_003870, partial [Coemansia sp. RSA 2681]